jgi:hypothetical protein
MEVTTRFNIGDVITISTKRRKGMKKCIDKAAIENILHKLWKKDTGYENIDIARIAYNRALQDVQKAIDSKQEEPVSEDKNISYVVRFLGIVVLSLVAIYCSICRSSYTAWCE